MAAGGQRLPWQLLHYAHGRFLLFSLLLLLAASLLIAICVRVNMSCQQRPSLTLVLLEGSSSYSNSHSQLVQAVSQYCRSNFLSVVFVSPLYCKHIIKVSFP